MATSAHCVTRRCRRAWQSRSDGGAPLGAMTTSAAAAPLCFGKRATITGAGMIKRNRRDDVFVAQMAQTASAVTVAEISSAWWRRRAIFTIGSGTTVRVDGGSGNDDIVGGNAATSDYRGGTGNDYIDGSGGFGGVTISGGSGDDEMYAAYDGLTVADGGSGNDHIGAGNGDSSSRPMVAVATTASRVSAATTS